MTPDEVGKSICEPATALNVDFKALEMAALGNECAACLCSDDVKPPHEEDSKALSDMPCECSVNAKP